MSDEMLPARGVDVPRREKFRISDLGVVRWIFYFRDARVRVVGTQRVLFLPLKQSPGKLTQEGEVWCRGRQPGQCGGAGERYRCCQLRLVRYMRVCRPAAGGAVRHCVWCLGRLGVRFPGASTEGSTASELPIIAKSHRRSIRHLRHSCQFAAIGSMLSETQPYLVAAVGPLYV